MLSTHGTEITSCGTGEVSWDMCSVEICAATPTLSPLPFAVMQKTCQQVLHLQGEQALATATQLEPAGQSTLETRIMQGIIAYFQGQWQIRQRGVAPVPGNTIR